MAARSIYLGFAAVAAVAVLAACSSSGGSGSASSSKPALLAKTATGTVAEWNWDIPGDDPGESAVLPLLIKTVEQDYPKLHVVNTSMSLSEQNDKLPLWLSGPRPARRT